MNDIRIANIVVLKWLRKKEVKSKKIDHIATTTKSLLLESTKISKAEKLRLTLLVIEPLAKRIALIPFLFPSLLKNNDIKNSMIVTGCRYEKGGVSPLSQEERIQLDKKSDRVCDIDKSMHSQGEKLLLFERQKITSI